jgi:hypothetical protein
MKFVLLILLFISSFAHAQLRPAQSQYLEEKGAFINPGFEQGKKGWTLANGTFGFGDTDYLNKNATLTVISQVLDFSQFTTNLTDFAGSQGLASCRILSSVSGLKFKVQNNSGTVSELSVASDSKWRNYEIPFVIDGTLNAIRIESDAATVATIQVDDCSLGLAPKGYIQQVGQAHFVGEASMAGLTNCQFQNTQSVAGAFESYPVDNDCNAYQVEGDLIASTKELKINIPNAVAGTRYRVELSALMFATNLINNDNTCDHALFWNGNRIESNTYSNYKASVGSFDRGKGIWGTFTPDTNGNVEIELKVAGSAVSDSCAVNNGGVRRIAWNVYAYPDSNATIVSQDAQVKEKAGFIQWSSAEINDPAWHLADGSCVLKSAYPDLARNYFNGSTYQYGECTTTTTNDSILLPDFVTDNRYLRMGGGSLSLGDTQTDQNLSHYHLNFYNAETSYASSPNLTPTTYIFAGMNGSGDDKYALRRTTTTANAGRDTSSGGAEARPNTFVALAYIRMHDSNKVIGKFENINSSELCQVEAQANDGESITVDTEDIPFKSITKDNCNNWSNAGNTGNNTNDAYTAKRDGFVLVTGYMFATSLAVNRIDAYINGIEEVGCGIFEGGTSNTNFSCLVNLKKDDVMTFRLSSNTLTLVATNSHKIKITELPDTEAIVKNLLAESSQTKCQTKFLTSDITTNVADIADLKFTGLTIGKKYRAVFNPMLTVSGDSQIVASILNGTTVLGINRCGSASGTVACGQSSVSTVFTATSTDLIASTGSFGGTSPTLSGNGTRGETHVELCQLPDSYTTTSQW